MVGDFFGGLLGPTASRLGALTVLPMGKKSRYIMLLFLSGHLARYLPFSCLNHFIQIHDPHWAPLCFAYVPLCDIFSVYGLRHPRPLSWTLFLLPALVTRRILHEDQCCGSISSRIRNFLPQRNRIRNAFRIRSKMEWQKFSQTQYKIRGKKIRWQTSGEQCRL